MGCHQAIILKNSFALSKDHKPVKTDKRRRILICGGHLPCRQVFVNQLCKLICQSLAFQWSGPLWKSGYWNHRLLEIVWIRWRRQSLFDGVPNDQCIECWLGRVAATFPPCTPLDLEMNRSLVDTIPLENSGRIIAEFDYFYFLETNGGWQKYARSRSEKFFLMIDGMSCIVVMIHRKTILYCIVCLRQFL